MSPEEFDNYLTLVGSLEENAIVRQFRAWVRQLPPAQP